MENLITRYRNVTILTALLFGQVLGLAMQVKRSSENRPTRLIRVWAVGAVTPLERGIVGLQNGVGNLWHNYFYLRGVRQENRDLKQKIQELEIERTRLSEDAEQAHRLQVLLNFKEQFIAQTLPAQVIGSSGSEQSRSVYIDKGSEDGVRADMAVMTAEGIVGKVLHVEKKHVASVLLINDQTSGVGAMLEMSRVQGVLRGTASGEVTLEKVMSDEAVQAGEKILTSGGDRIFPKGLPVGTVSKASQQDLFLNIRVKPAADLNRLEEVLVITRQEEREPAVADGGRMRASDILAERLPSVPDKPASVPAKPPTAANPALPRPGNTNLNPSNTASTVMPAPKTGTVPVANGSKLVNAPAATKPAGLTPVVKPSISPTTKPAAESATEGGNKSKPPASQPQTEPAQTPAEPNPNQDQPQ